METIRTKIHFIIMFIGSAGVGISIEFEIWSLASILAICTIGAFIFNIGVLIAEVIDWHSTSIKSLLNEQEYDRLKRELKEKQK